MDAKPKIAIVHDYLMDFGGAEQVLLALHEIYPDAPVYVSLIDKKGMGTMWSAFAGIDIRTTWFNRLPFSSRLISPLRFLLPLIWGSLDLSTYDVILDSSSWAITRGFKRRDDQVEICYCHTPPRYLYGFDTSRKWEKLWFGGLIRVYGAVVNRFMRAYDFAQAKKVDFFLANSANTAARIKKFWHRDAVVLFPPVDVERIFRSSVPPRAGGYYLAGGRLVAAKNFDLIIRACEKAGVSLKIFGTGILEAELRGLATESVTFLGKLSTEELIAYYKGARGFIVAQKDEDFGMTLVEAFAAGCPVIAYAGGGYKETMIEGKTGVFFHKLTVDSLTEALEVFGQTTFSKKIITSHAKQFSKAVFQQKIRAFVDQAIKNKNKRGLDSLSSW